MEYLEKFKYNRYVIIKLKMSIIKLFFSISLLIYFLTNNLLLNKNLEIFFINQLLTKKNVAKHHGYQDDYVPRSDLYSVCI